MVGWPVMPVMVHGHPYTVVLDLGTTGNIFSSEATQQFGGAGGALDSLMLGTSVSRNLSYDPFDGRFDEGDSARGLAPVVGLLGTPVLSHYDFVFDGPTDHVRLYAATPRSASTGRHDQAWYPAGIQASDCVPMEPDPNGNDRVFFPLQSNGHAIHSMFDSGSETTNINLAAAKVLGITKRTPGIRLTLPGEAGQFSMYNGQKVWRVSGFPIIIGTHTLRDGSINIYQHLPRETSPEDPELSLGLDSVHDRTLFISYSTGQFCMSEPPPQKKS